MYNLIQAISNSDTKTALRQLLGVLKTSGKQYFLRNEILQTFAEYCFQSQKPAYFHHSSALGELIHYTHELILDEESIWLLLRPWVGSQQVWRLAADLSRLEPMPPQALLEARDRQVDRHQSRILEIDFGPYYRNSPTISDPTTIGQGLAFLNHYLCDQVLADPQYWLEMLFNVLHRHHYDGIPLLINDRIHSGTELAQRVKQGLKLASQRSPIEPYETFHLDFQELGFEPGWGNTASRVCETLELLERLIDTPNPAILEAFISRIPDMFRIVLVSIHGWVGQEKHLGRPETTGKVAYVLEQARSLEHKLYEDIELSGLDHLGIEPQVVILTRLIPNAEGTRCHQRLEKVEDTENTWILRVSFRDDSKVTQNWMSKFEVWPYLETFAMDAERELRVQLRGRPNLIIGNCSDGNLVAFLLARRFKAIQCNIAHCLEKSKYLFSDLLWQDFEAHYHFSTQFTADLISMNAADFIITSSYEEIVGTPDMMGQYESYKCFTMPQLYHVVNGIDLFSPKFNRVPPGVNQTRFFPYSQVESRNFRDRTRVQDLLFSRKDPHILGYLDDPDKRPILAIASVNLIKNLKGLVECFGKSQALQARCNLILITTKLHFTEAINAEEAGEIEQIHDAINQYGLHGRIRWVGMRLPGLDLGEVYRVIAAHGGIFCNFARFDACGRVVLEAMASGLPAFVTQFGGAAEIIEDGRCGFLINPTDLAAAAEKMVHFINQCDAEPQDWHEISQRAIQRVQDEYNWTSHTKQLLSLAKIYSFWNYVDRDNREMLHHYLEALFYLIYNPKAEAILEQHQRETLDFQPPITQSL